jgi:hypothetical protein
MNNKNIINIKNKKLNNNLKDISRKMISILFLLLFVNSIFASNIDSSRINTTNNKIDLKEELTNSCSNIYLANESVSELSYVFNRGNGCYTVELPSESVSKIWNDILVKGFKIDEIGSNELPNTNRDTLEKNELLLTEAGAQAGDIALKKEVPNQLINTKEIPSLINQSCTGSFQYGLNLDTTLRVGRCLDPEQGCYTNGDGLFRQNGEYGFFKELHTISKDVLDWIGLNKAKEEVGELLSDEEYNSTVDLGVFSDSSLVEIEKYKKALENSDTNSLNLEKMTIIKEKAIENSFEVGNFAADMQTTCKGEDCYINSYSLFDKMFNQYFSVDMVLSASSPLLLNGAANIFGNKYVKKVFDFIPNSLKKTGIIKKGGFWDNLLDDPVNMFRNPRSAFQKAWYSKNNSVDNFINHLKNPGALSPLFSTDVRLRDMQNHKILNQVKDVLSKTLDAKELDSVLTKGYINGEILDKLSKSQKRALYDVMSQYRGISEISSNIVKNITNDDQLVAALDLLNTGKAQGKTVDEIISTLSEEQVNLLQTHSNSLNKLSKAIKDESFESINISSVLKEKADLTNPMKSTTIVYTDAAGNPQSINAKINSVKKGTNISSIDDKIYEKGFSNLDTLTTTVNTVDGIPLTRTRAVTYVKQIDTGSARTLGSIDVADSFSKTNPEGFIRYTDPTGIHTISASAFNKDTFTGVPASLEGFDSTIDSLNRFLETSGVPRPQIDDLVKKYSVDELDISYDTFNNLPKKFEDNSKNVNKIMTTFENKELAGVRGTNFINQQMNTLTGKSYWNNFLLKPAPSFGVNLLYWELRSGGATIFGDVLDTKRMSMYRLPETYSAMHISHGETPNIYKDAYIDFFANDGSDQGDLFMAFLDSMVFWAPYLIKEGLKLVPIQAVDALNTKIDDVLRGKIKRNEVDDIVLYTDTINTGCGTSCTITLNNKNYIDKTTINKTLENQKEENSPGFIKTTNKNENLKEEITNQKIQNKYQQMDYAIDQLETGLKSFNTDQEQIDSIKENYTKQYKEAIDYSIPEIEKNVSNDLYDIDDQININFVVPNGIMVQNYILENTSKKNLEEKGQNLISFAHHVDYEGTTANETNKNAINLVTARNTENTCEQKLENLKFLGRPIGWSVPKNYRAVGIMLLQEHLTYITMPAYKNTWILAALGSSVPQQTIIMPEIYGCVDDQEGQYNHFFVSTRADEELIDNKKNQVGEMVEKGLDNVGESLSKISSGTDFEKTVQTGTNEAKKFIENNIKEYPIVQSRLITNGSVNGNVNGQLFFIELGPNTSCNVNSLDGDGSEILKDKSLEESLKIDKENGELSLINKDGEVNTIVDKENSDFVRLIGTNLGIPAKIIPHSLSYIPVPDTNSELFEIDVYGNFLVLDNDFLDCLKAGYEAQTGLIIEKNTKNLRDYFGNVKNINILNPLTQYNVYPQNNKIVAEGTPRLVGNSNLSKLKINGTRKSELTHINNEQVNLGKNISIQFENAQLIYSGEKNSYIMWVQHTSVTNANDIQSLNTTLVKENANNGCEDEEIALGFKVKPSNTNKDSQTAANVDKLNTALENVGPFKMFDTETKTFIFYLSDPPECEQRLKIIDKLTGEIYDQKITSIEETPNGIKIGTEDGIQHEFEFSADNGVPELKYNGERETLVSAQGDNGSFWYDPKTGNWYTENGHLIPFNGEFKEGMLFSANEDGTVTGKASQNVFNIGSSGSSGSSGGFNIPLTPKSFINLILYISIIIFGIMFVNYNIKNKKLNTKK